MAHIARIPFPPLPARASLTLEIVQREPTSCGRRLPLPGGSGDKVDLVVLADVDALLSLSEGAGDVASAVAFAEHIDGHHIVLSGFILILIFIFSRDDLIGGAVLESSTAMRRGFSTIIVQSNEQVVLLRPSWLGGDRSPTDPSSFAELADLSGVGPEAFLWVGRLWSTTSSLLHDVELARAAL